MNVRTLLAGFSQFPWKTTARTLAERFREDRLGVTASSLTFTTTMSLVPMFTVALAVVTAFPMFGKMQDALQAWLAQSLIPDAIARQVLGYLNQFAGKANRLGFVGVAVLFFTALALVLTIDRTLNEIWRVRQQRPLGQRVLIYWAVMTLGPLLMGASVSLSSYLLSASRGLIGGIPGGVQFLLTVFEFLLLSAGLAALYRYVPNTPVRRSHAWAGAVFAAFGIEVARRALAFYVSKIASYSAVYGTFATLPILLLWIYILWVILLLGAVFAAYLPSLLAGTRRRATAHGWQFQLALEVLQQLQRARGRPERGMSADLLVEALEVDALQLEPVLETLVRLDWIGRINEATDLEGTRYILLADEQATPLEPLMQALLLPRSEATDRLWKSGGLSTMWLKDVLEPPAVSPEPEIRS